MSPASRGEQQSYPGSYADAGMLAAELTRVEAERDRLAADLEIAVQRADRHKAMMLTLAGREGRLREALEHATTLVDKYGGAIVKISEANDGTAGGAIRVRAILAGLVTVASDPLDSTLCEHGSRADICPACDPVSERDRLRDALERIAEDGVMVVHDESGSWIDTGIPQKIAREALRLDPKQASG